MKSQTFDICIIGGGPVGLAVAAALSWDAVARSAEHARPLSVALIEQNDIAPTLTTKFDGRTIALAHQGIELLKCAGVWKELQQHAEPMQHIRIADQHSSLKLDFHAEELGVGPFGFMVENRHLRSALWQQVKKQKNVTVFCPASVKDFSLDGHMASVTLNNGDTINAALIIAADGRFSPSKKKQNISNFGFSYEELALTCTIEHSNPHNNIALEHFLPEGPLATLPLTGNRSGIVWTAKPDTVKTLLDLDEDDFLQLLAQHGAGWLGDLKLHTPRVSYPLSLQHAHTYTAPHFVLVGDAAHVMHPIAGQGFNMGLRDVACLVRLIEDARTRGLRADDTSVLTQYEMRRRHDNQSMLAATDLIDRLFRSGNPLLKPARKIGLALVDAIGPLRRYFMAQAMGLNNINNKAA